MEIDDMKHKYCVLQFVDLMWHVIGLYETGLLCLFCAVITNRTLKRQVALFEKYCHKF